MDIFLFFARKENISLPVSPAEMELNYKPWHMTPDKIYDGPYFTHLIPS